ncbi:MAG TPA: PsbP-related protein, partial [Nitrososphaeraceae archaeon]|nr:PsbP-related protein [Nitrososphaeraceae archaeon]
MNLIKLLVATVVIATTLSIFTSNIHAQWTIPSSSDISNSQQQQQTNFVTYENSDSGIKIDYPADWNKVENSVTDIEFHPPPEAATTEVKATDTSPPATTAQSDVSIKLTVTPLQSNTVTMNSIVDETLKDKSKNLENFLLLESAIVQNPKAK